MKERERIIALENSPASATRLDGANVSTVEAGLLSAPRPVPLYTFSIPGLNIFNTRSLFEDTDYVSLIVAVGSNPPQTKTLKIGNVGNGSHTVGLSFDGISVPAGQNAVLTYAVVNSDHNSDSEVESALEKAGNNLAQAAATATAKAIGDLIGAELGAAIGTAAVPIIGTALGVILVAGRPTGLHRVCRLRWTGGSRRPHLHGRGPRRERRLLHGRRPNTGGQVAHRLRQQFQLPSHLDRERGRRSITTAGLGGHRSAEGPCPDPTTRHTDWIRRTDPPGPVAECAAHNSPPGPYDCHVR